MTGPSALQRVLIERLGRRGEGVGAADGTPLYVPYALPGETVSVDRDGDRGTMIGLLEASAERVAPVCRHFTSCGGCAVQTWARAPYARWKRQLLVDALARQRGAADGDGGLDTRVAALVDAHGAGRRRATFHSRIEPDGTSRVGFMRARAHAIVPIEECPILDPRLGGALPAARAISKALATNGKPLDIVVAASEAGLDVDLRGAGPLGDDERRRLVAIATAHDLARIANHGTIVIERRKPTVSIGAARVELAPGAFQQATAKGEAALAERVLAGVADARRVADLFCGIGTFALRIAAATEVAAYDTEAAPLAALDRAARHDPGLRPVRTEVRNLFERPLVSEELQRVEAVVLDPPRAGAEAQMRAIAASTLARVVSVSCDAQTFARDAAILAAGGFATDRIEPIDQFRYSPHLEIVATFRRPPAKRKRRLLG